RGRRLPWARPWLKSRSVPRGMGLFKKAPPCPLPRTGKRKRRPPCPPPRAGKGKMLALSRSPKGPSCWQKPRASTSRPSREVVPVDRSAVGMLRRPSSGSKPPPCPPPEGEGKRLPPPRVMGGKRRPPPCPPPERQEIGRASCRETV